MKKNLISPVGLKGKEINERMKELMGITHINENKSNIAVELTKIGPDGNAYAVIRENQEWYIKKAEKTTNLVAEDFKYIGGLMNKKSEAYPSYAKAIKHLNLKFKSLAEAYNFDGEINVFENDNLISESGMAGFSEMKSNGFSGHGNLEGQKSMDEMYMDEMYMDESSKAAREFIGKEISHLERDKGYEHKRAVAAALNIARKKGYKVEESWMEETWNMEEAEIKDDKYWKDLANKYGEELLSKGNLDAQEAYGWGAEYARREREEYEKKMASDVELTEEEMAIHKMMEKYGMLANEESKPNDGNLANNYPPYDKVTKGDVVAGRLGKDEMGGKNVSESKLSISKAIENVDSMIDGLKKKV